MTPSTVVAVGASAGGVEALRALVGGLPANLPAAVLVVLHLPPSAPSALPAILNRSGPLPAAAAVDGELLRPGCVYVAPADRHLLVMQDRIRLSVGPTENGHRPAIDPLFRSVARAFGPGAVGVVLSGSRDDGAAGLSSIAAHGGRTVVQEPDDALYPSMPLAALARVQPDHVLPAAKVGGALADLTAGAAEPSASAGRYGCPDCSGVLFELPAVALPRFRCRVGHAWSPESLLAEQTIALESALWMALRALQEKSELSRRMAAGQADRGGARMLRLETIAGDADDAGALIRDLIDRIGRGERAPGSAAGRAG